MKPSRRAVLHLAAGATATQVGLHFAWAQAYPARPIRLSFHFHWVGHTTRWDAHGPRR